jgi:hypothetical protein
MIVRFIDLGGIDDHCCLEVIVRFVDLGGIDDHCCLEVPRSTKRTITSKQQWSSIPPRSTE